MNFSKFSFLKLVLKLILWSFSVLILMVKERVKEKMSEDLHVCVGVMKDSTLIKLRELHVSHTLGSAGYWNTFF